MKATGTQHADLSASVAVINLSDLVLQDVPTTYDDEYNNTSSSLLFLNNGKNHPQTFASIFEQNIPVGGVFTSHLVAGTSSHQISMPVFLVNRATMHCLLAIDAYIIDYVANSLITR
ncbi:hypothetical protein ACFX2C_003113 [Malus domestica]